MRTQKEIMERFETLDKKDSDDFFGHQRSDLVRYLTFENARPHLSEQALDGGEENWKQLDDPEEEIKEYLSFAYGKAHNQRSLSAGRFMEHYKTWIWLDDDVFYKEIVESIENYDNYGIPVLNRIAQHYGLSKEEE